MATGEGTTRPFGSGAAGCFAGVAMDMSTSDRVCVRGAERKKRRAVGGGLHRGVMWFGSRGFAMELAATLVRIQGHVNAVHEIAATAYGLRGVACAEH